MARLNTPQDLAVAHSTRRHNEPDHLAVVGGLIGWIASLIMKTDAQQGLVLNVVVGIIGALVGGWLLSPLVGAGTVNQGDFSLMGLLVSLAGAVVLLFVVNLIRRGTPRV